VSISILLLTLNEESNLPDCLASVGWSNDIVLLDSFSTDRTVEIAKRSGCRVFQRKFDNWAAHQNWAVRNIPFRNSWVLYMDADERCTKELADEILATCNADSAASAYRVRRKDFFMGRWLRHAQLYPTWLVRVFRPEKISYERLVNPVAIVDGDVQALDGHLHHFPFNRGIGHWISRHNQYSDLEARELFERTSENRPSLKDCLSNDPNRRRLFFKAVFTRLPGRPAIKFVYYYLVRFGWLDGAPGFTYSSLQAVYEYMILLKVRELKRRSRNLPA